MENQALSTLIKKSKPADESLRIRNKIPNFDENAPDGVMPGGITPSGNLLSTAKDYLIRKITFGPQHLRLDCVWVKELSKPWNSQRSAAAMPNIVAAVRLLKTRCSMELEMENQIEIAKHRLFAGDELDVSDVKLFPGTSRDTTPRQMAEEVNKVIAQMLDGNYTLMEDDEY